MPVLLRRLPALSPIMTSAHLLAATLQAHLLDAVPLRPSPVAGKAPMHTAVWKHTGLPPQVQARFGANLPPMRDASRARTLRML